ncbi:Bug family tripartite tricarboxylate transporter substrate binding protein [Anaeroselena agilis]|uniref:Tripartite tricarboxylate transporter substrate binding protein n=1 Tax=Anaeroselena agilis TaxID=3063788 RepID=A0ABU3P470_9FIRM|nr:tripartite tricarboxylate transporter substrate binding protein [Selenomonadales bacterium 4137-cl]
MKKTRLTIIATVLVCLALVFTAGCSDKKAAKFPSEPITMIVNYGGGGGTDISARALAQAAEKHLGVPVTVINKAGGVGTTGIIELKNKKPDGYTIGVVTYAPLAIVPHQMKVPYTPEDFNYICAYGIYRYGLAVKADSPYKTVDDLVAAAAKKPDGMPYVASGYPQPFVYQKISELKKVKFVHVPTKSGSETNTAVLGGHVESAVAVMSDLMPFVKSKEMRILASVSSARLEIAPDVPTLKEQGYDIAINSYMGVGVPKGVPADRLKVLREAFAKAFKDPEFQAVMKKMNVPANYIPGDEFGKICAEGYKESAENLKAMKKK